MVATRLIRSIEATQSADPNRPGYRTTNVSHSFNNAPGLRLSASTAALLCAALMATDARAQDGTDQRSGARIGLEAGPVWFSRNDVRIPGDTGTEFDMRDLTGSGPEAFVRINANWDINARHGLRVVLAPLEVSGTGNLSQDTSFAGTTFPAGSTAGTYRFSTYKLTYRYTFLDRDAWRWRVGFTGLVRDARIELEQGDLRASDDDFGFVPLLHLYGEYAFADRWSLILDFDGLAGGPGRAFDIALQLTYDINRRWRIGGGYRTVEGGVDTGSVYNFAWLHYAGITLDYRL